MIWVRRRPNQWNKVTRCRYSALQKMISITFHGTNKKLVVLLSFCSAVTSERADYLPGSLTPTRAIRITWTSKESELKMKRFITVLVLPVVESHSVSVQTNRHTKTSSELSVHVLRSRCNFRTMNVPQCSLIHDVIFGHKVENHVYDEFLFKWDFHEGSHWKYDVHWKKHRRNDEYRL